jgi:hypothetical protein
MPLPELLPGDALLYFTRGNLFDYLVALKTWNLVSHIEIYRGGGMSVAARHKGVNQYPLRHLDLAYILRPRVALDLEKANKWFYGVQGQGYDFIGLLVFMSAVKRGTKRKMFCSEFATRFYRHAGSRPFADYYDADRIAPAQFLQSPAFDWIWWHDKARHHKASALL